MSDKLKQVEVRLKLVEGEGLTSEDKITNPDDAVRVIADFLAELDREQVCVVNMDGAGHPINFNIVSIGDVNSSVAPMQNIFKTAILSNAASIIVLHNHPSSDILPSAEDKMVTQRIMYASLLMNITLQDHVIVGGGTGRFHSMRAEQPELFNSAIYRQLLSNVADAGATAFENDVKETGLVYKAEQSIENRFGIYQITEGGAGEAYRFFGTDFAKEQNISISGQDYSLVYSGEIGKNDTLDSLFEKFNLNRPEDFTGHSLSVSDVILWKTGEDAKAYFVDSFGFTELPTFIQERENLIEQKDIVVDNQNQGKKRDKSPGVKEITEQLEQGLKELFDSDKYREYLTSMSKFHNYSFNNTLLIAMQKPEATLVASYNSWQKNFKRHVKKGEKGIRIFAPAPYKRKVEREVVDVNTRQPVKDNAGHVKKEEVEVTVPAFKAVSVFDVSQTEGEPIPELVAEELLQSVEGYQDFMSVLHEISPVPIAFEEIASEAKGYFSPVEQRIVVQPGMSESQTLKTTVHEISHSLLHDKENVRLLGVDDAKDKSRSSKEVEAESVAFTVCQHFGIDTSDYSFGYVAGWSSGKEMKELKESMETIRKTASKLISDIEGKMQELTQQHLLDKEKLLVSAVPIRENLGTYETTSQAIMNFKALTAERFHPIGEMDAAVVEQVVKDYVSGKMKALGVKAEIVDLAIIGSRNRGVESQDSDLDVVMEYKGDIREDDLFQILHEDHLQLDGILIDINPITEGKTGTLATYLPEAQAYMDKQQAFSIANRYISIQETEGGYDYSILGRDYKEIDGGVYDNPHVSIHEALADIVDDLKQSADTNGAKGTITADSSLVPINFDELMEKVESVNELKQVVTFTVAECGEYHQMGVYYDDIATAEDAIQRFHQLRDSPLNGIPALGIRIHTIGQPEYEDVQVDFVSGKRIDVSILEYIPSMRENVEAMEKLSEVMVKMPDYLVIGTAPVELSVQMVLRQLDSNGTVFSPEERELILDYGIQLGDMDKTKQLAEHIYTQEVDGNQDVALAIIDAKAEIEAASLVTLPDATMTIRDMHEYGYLWKEMLPLSQERALELYQKGVEVLKLYPDDTETYPTDEEDIKEHEGIFGIEKAMWEKWKDKILPVEKKTQYARS